MYGLKINQEWSLPFKIKQLNSLLSFLPPESAAQMSTDNQNISLLFVFLYVLLFVLFMCEVKKKFCQKWKSSDKLSQIQQLCVFGKEEIKDRSNSITISLDWSVMIFFFPNFLCQMNVVTRCLGEQHWLKAWRSSGKFQIGFPSWRLLDRGYFQRNYCSCAPFVALSGFECSCTKAFRF